MDTPEEGGRESLPPPSLTPVPPPAEPAPQPPTPRVDVPGGAGMPGASPPTPYGAQPPPPGYPPPPPGYPPPPPGYPPQYGAPPPPSPYPPPATYGYGYPSATADGPAPGLRYAGFGIRAAAYLLDGIILLIIVLLVSPALGGFTRATVTDINGLVVNTQEVNPAVELFEFLIGAVYFVGFWTFNTRTPGMIPFRLRVLRADDGRPLGIGMAVVRYVGLLIGFFVILLGVIWVAIDPRHQGWHDKMASTFVVQEVTPGTWHA